LVTSFTDKKGQNFQKQGKKPFGKLLHNNRIREH